MNKSVVPKISVILTVHNAQDSLRECVKSVCDQSFREIEILCIDGGSVDASPEILRELALEDNRIRIINDKNTSYGHKVNIGMDIAKGKYISILESDDLYKKEMLEHLYMLAEQYDVDFVDSDYIGIYYVDGIRCEIPISKYGNNQCYDRLQTIRDRDRILQSSTGAIWTGLYKKDFLVKNHIRMFESAGAAYQDTSFRFLVSALAERVFHSKEHLYLYRIDNVNSSIHDMEKIFTISKEYDFLKDQISSRGFGDEVWDGFYKWKYGSYFWNVGRLDSSARTVFIEHYKKELQDDILNSRIRRGTTLQEQYTFLMLDDEDKFIRLVEDFHDGGNLGVHHLHRMVEFLKDKNVIIFGSGIRAKSIIDILKGTPIKIQCVCDNDSLKWHTRIAEYDIYSVEETYRLYPEHVYVIPHGKYEDEMKNQLEDLGVKKSNIYITNI